MQNIDRLFRVFRNNLTLSRIALVSVVCLLGAMFVCGPLSILVQHPKDSAAAKEIASELGEFFPDSTFTGAASYERPRIYVDQQAGARLSRADVELKLKTLCDRRLPGYEVWLQILGETTRTKLHDQMKLQ